ncbi:hypothetical protein X753_07240 [Mesorhizobium sp. LNJC399B00]|nr:hypothetical protein X753_07240 [Mesorhizobium sp. LNJC399B00]
MCSSNQRGVPQCHAEPREIAGLEGTVDRLEQAMALAVIFGDFQHRRDPEGETNGL